MSFYLLLQDLNDSDRLFVEKIYMEYKNYMYNVAYGVLKHKQDAEDAVNDAMCKIIKYLSKFDESANEEICNMITVCIRNIVKNKAIDNYNKKKKHEIHQKDHYFRNDEADEHIALDFEDERASLDDIVIKKEECEIVRKALTDLTQDMQDAVNLVYMCGYSSVEAADFLGISDGAVRARLFKARNKLRDALKKGMSDYGEK